MPTRRNRILPALVAVSLLAVSVVGIAARAAAVPPSAPLIDSPVDGTEVAKGSAVIPSGTTDAGTDTVTVTDQGSAYCTATVTSPATTWTCGTPTSTLSYGTHQFSALANVATEPSAASNPVVVTVTPPTPAITFPADNTATTNSTFTLSGTIDNPDAQAFTVQVSDTVAGVSDARWCQATISGGTTWSCSDTLSGNGVHTFVSESWLTADASRLSDASAPFMITLGDTEPTALAQPADGSSPRPLFTGTGPAMGTMDVAEGSVPLCSTTVAADNSWSCQPAADLAVGSHSVVATGTPVDSGSTSAPGQVTILAPAPVAPVVVPPVAAVVPVKPIPTAAAYVVGFSTGGDSYSPGDAVIFTGSGPPGATVDAEIHSTPIALGSTVVGSDGTFSLTTLIPKNMDPGAHHLVISVTEPGNAPVVVERPITVVAPTPIATTSEAGDGGTADSPRRASPQSADRNAPGAENSLTDSLPTVQAVLKNPAIIGVAAAAGLVLLLFVAFPAELLNSTLAENYDRIFGRLPKVRLPWLARLRRGLATAPVTGGLALTTLIALIFGFVDPHFGFDLASLRLVLACGIALFFIGYVSNAVAARIARGRWGVVAVLELKPLGLLLTLVGVILSRLLDFSPGFLIGLILGISLANAATERQRARTVLVRSGLLLAMSVAAWLLLSTLMAGGKPGSFGATFGVETLSAIAIEGVTLLVVGLLPFRYLEGEHVYRESRILWAFSYLVVLFAFCLLVLPSVDGWEFVGTSLWIWIIVVGGFAVVALGLYVFFRTRFGSKSDDDDVTKKGRHADAGARSPLA